jgi:hypothetical protein
MLVMVAVLPAPVLWQLAEDDSRAYRTRDLDPQFRSF